MSSLKNIKFNFDDYIFIKKYNYTGNYNNISIRVSKIIKFMEDTSVFINNAESIVSVKFKTWHLGSYPHYKGIDKLTFNEDTPILLGNDYYPLKIEDEDLKDMLNSEDEEAVMLGLDLALNKYSPQILSE